MGSNCDVPAQPISSCLPGCWRIIRIAQCANPVFISRDGIDAGKSAHQGNRSQDGAKTEKILPLPGGGGRLPETAEGSDRDDQRQHVKRGQELNVLTAVGVGGGAR